MTNSSAALAAIEADLREFAFYRSRPKADQLREIVEITSRRNAGVEVIYGANPEVALRLEDLLNSSQQLSELQNWLLSEACTLDRERQATIRRRSIADEYFTPRVSQVHLQAVGNASYGKDTAMPTGGLWTSTEFESGLSAWSLWMMVGGESSSFVGPSFAWRLLPDASVRVLEITGVQDWLNTVAKFPRAARGYDASVDWTAIASEYDAVHISLKSAVGTQGFALATTEGRNIAPAYFATECTFWTRWCFKDIQAI